jgi:anti-sigma regulatory factor (Ser/Thr protein kinase)
MEFSARAEHLAQVRKLVERLAARSDLHRDEVDDFLTAVDEAVANAIRHGSPRGGDHDSVRVTGRSLADALVVEVEDHGKGFAIPSAPVMPSPDAPGGRGLPLMCALADTVEIASDQHGTRVTLKKHTGQHRS